MGICNSARNSVHPDKERKVGELCIIINKLKRELAQLRHDTYNDQKITENAIIHTKEEINYIYKILQKHHLERKNSNNKIDKLQRKIMDYKLICDDRIPTIENAIIDQNYSINK